MIRTYETSLSATNKPYKKIISGFCIFTEEEYNFLFNGDKILVPAIKTEFTKKGLKCSNAARVELEHFAFNNIVRETSKLIPFYKTLVSKELTHSFVENYVIFRRKSSKDSYKSPNYCNLIVGIILSNSKDKELEYRDLDFRNRAMSNIANGKYFLKNSSLIPSNPNCSHCSSTYWDSALKILLNCQYCSRKAVEFADDCIIKLGKPIYEKIFTKYFVIDQLFIHDILTVIFLFYLKL
jgi:hypothetical protein